MSGRYPTRRLQLLENRQRVTSQVPRRRGGLFRGPCRCFRTSARIHSNRRLGFRQPHPLKSAEDPRSAPADLGSTLNLSQPTPQLHVHILVWDFAMIFALERETAPFFGPGWRHHSRIHFHMDGNHPIGASHHSKIVVVDDAVAFVGGLDLARGRWIPRNIVRRTPGALTSMEHFCRRTTTSKSRSKAKRGRIRRVARDRWWRATGKRLRAPKTQNSPWPDR